MFLAHFSEPRLPLFEWDIGKYWPLQIMRLYILLKGPIKTTWFSMISFLRRPYQLVKRVMLYNIKVLITSTTPEISNVWTPFIYLYQREARCSYHISLDTTHLDLVLTKFNLHIFPDSIELTRAYACIVINCRIILFILDYVSQFLSNINNFILP